MKQIFTSNWESLAENFESTQSNSLQVLRQMEEAVGELRSTAASALTECKLIERLYKELLCKKNSWQQKTADAINLDRDDLARQALEQKNKIDDEIDEIINRLNKADAEAEKYKEELRQAELKFTKMQNQYRLFEHQQLILQSGVSAVASQVDNVAQLEKDFCQLNQQNGAPKMSLDDEFDALKNNIKSKNKTEK